MNKYILSAILSCMVLLCSAKEYVFDLRDATIPTTGNTLEMTSADGEITFTITIPTSERLNPSITYSMGDCVFDSQTGRLKIIWGSGASVHVTQNNGRNLNFVELGEWNIASSGENFFFNDAHINPDRSSRIMDYIPNDDEDQAIAINAFNLKNSADKTRMEANYTSWENSIEMWIGPTFIVRDEEITLEDLTFADHAVKDFMHTITDDLVGVVVEDALSGIGRLLFCRSAQPISSRHKHSMKPGQEMWVHRGVVPEYADTATVQYAWIALKLDDPDQYVGKRFNNVRGLYCAASGRERGNYFGWLNPNMQVESTPVILESNVITHRNTYCVANFSEQDDTRFFFMEPRPVEVCNVVEAMRTGNDVILAPTSDAITPDGNQDYIYDDVEGGTAFYNGYGLGVWPYEHDYAFIEVDSTYCESRWDTPISFAWRTYFKLFDFTDVVAICFSHYQADDANHDYPLDTPNFYYDQDQTAILFGLMGTGDTHASLSGSYDEDFFVGYSDYYSRYDWHRDINVYKNDMHINLIDHPHEGDEHLAAFGDLDLMRCDFAGRPLALVATLECLAPGEYRVHYNDSSQTAINNGVIDEKLVENGQVLGLPVVNDQVFDLTTSTGDSSVPHISFSDCFFSEEMLTRSSIENMNTDYTYRLYSHNNGTEIRAILSHIPVYTIQLNEIWRANLTKDEVDADTEGTLALENDLHIKFLSNHDMHVLRYHLLEGHGNDEEHEIDEIDTGNEGRDPYEHYDQHENDGLIGWDGLWFVPEIQSNHNNNTYGCYKETINRAYVYLDRDHSRPSSKLVMSMLQVTGADGKPYRYFHTGLSLWSRQEIYQNANPEERYLYRIWREVKSDGNGSQAPRRTGSSGSNRVLLNEAPELEVNNDLYSYWTTDYAGLQEFTGESLVVSDTFLAEVPADPAELENFALNVEYQAVLYIHDTVEDLYYPVSSMVVPVTWDLSDHSSVVTGLMSIDADNRTVADVEYYNVTGQRMTAPSGITIVVTRFTDGTSMTTKQIFK